MGYSLSYFEIRRDSPSEYHDKSYTSGLYYFIELMGHLDSYGVGVAYRSKLNSDQKQYWNTLSFSLSYVW